MLILRRVKRKKFPVRATSFTNRLYVVYCGQFMYVLYILLCAGLPISEPFGISYARERYFAHFRRGWECRTYIPGKTQAWLIPELKSDLKNRGVCVCVNGQWPMVLMHLHPALPDRPLACSKFRSEMEKDVQQKEKKLVKEENGRGRDRKRRSQAANPKTRWRKMEKDVQQKDRELVKEENGRGRDRKRRSQAADLKKLDFIELEPSST